MFLTTRQVQNLAQNRGISIQTSVDLANIAGAKTRTMRRQRRTSNDLYIKRSTLR